MPVWAWLGFVLMIAYNSFVLWRAWSHMFQIWTNHLLPLNETPIYFWFFAFIFGVCELFLVGFFSLIVVSVIWGPIFHQ